MSSTRRQPIPRRLASGWLLILLLAALLAELLLGPTPALNPLLATRPPSAAHWLGTDPYGRDVLALCVGGARSLLLVSLPAAALMSVLGLLLGAAAGWWGNRGPRLTCSDGLVALVALSLMGWQPPSWNWLPAASLLLLLAGGLRRLWPAQPAWFLPLDALLLSSTLLLGALPRLVLVLAFCALGSPAPGLLVAVLTLTGWQATARLARSQVRQLSVLGFIEAGRAQGFSASRLLRYHVLPNSWPVLRAVLPLNLHTCLGLQTTLAFLGLGLPPEAADWGRLLALARLEPGAWWLVLFPLLALAATSIALHTLLPAALNKESN
ncbi:ABC transporter permease [Hymenobacter sp. B81]|uniref:ABC transporter permease n=1 Tax=Hymenobacter sp. B81 TaxID=3344878 RepID=UPI0037DD2BF1